jgi:hypothetical protein
MENGAIVMHGETDEILKRYEAEEMPRAEQALESPVVTLS